MSDPTVWIEIRDMWTGTVHVLRPVDDPDLAMRWIYNRLKALEPIAPPGTTKAEVTIGLWS